MAADGSWGLHWWVTIVIMVMIVMIVMMNQNYHNDYDDGCRWQLGLALVSHFLSNTMNYSNLFKLQPAGKDDKGSSCCSVRCSWTLWPHGSMYGGLGGGSSRIYTTTSSWKIGSTELIFETTAFYSSCWKIFCNYQFWHRRSDENWFSENLL